MRNKPSLYHFSLTLFIIFSLTYSSFSQTDTLAVGRECKLVFHNGTSAEGTISYRGIDSVTLKTEYTQHSIAVKDIQFVLRPNEDVPVESEIEKTENEKGPFDVQVISSECDVYLDDRSVLKDVNLFAKNDSTLVVFKEMGKREVSYSEIRKIAFKPSAPFGKGYLIGSAIGFLIGFIPPTLSRGGGHPDFSGPGVGLIVGLIFSVPCGLIGGVIGLLTAQDEVYLFDKGAPPVKKKRIDYLIEQHPK
jgi:hypothetical protein